jgi:hypothetical protein
MYRMGKHNAIDENQRRQKKVSSIRFSDVQLMNKLEDNIGKVYSSQLEKGNFAVELKVPQVIIHITNAKSSELNDFVPIFIKLRDDPLSSDSKPRNTISLIDVILAIELYRNTEEEDEGEDLEGFVV